MGTARFTSLILFPSIKKSQIEYYLYLGFAVEQVLLERTRGCSPARFPNINNIIQGNSFIFTGISVKVHNVEANKMHLENYHIPGLANILVSRGVKKGGW